MIQAPVSHAFDEPVVVVLIVHREFTQHTDLVDPARTSLAPLGPSRLFDLETCQRGAPSRVPALTMSP